VIRRLASIMHLSGRLALYEGNLERAHAELAESIRLLKDTGQQLFSSWALAFFGYAALRQDNLKHARAAFEQSLQDFQQANYPIGVVFNVEGLASLAVQRKQLARATRLFAWADATREAIDDPRPPVEQADVDRDLEVIHTQLDDTTFEAERAAGRKMTIDEAIECALKIDDVSD
jgi:hypothetical protein